MANSETFEFDMARLPYVARIPLLRKLEHSSPDDLLNLFQVFPSEHFREPTEDTKSSWLFEKLFPLLLPYLARKYVFQCRLVCYRWKLAIDRTLANVCLGEPDYKKPVTMNEFPFGVHLCDDDYQLRAVLEEMEAHSCNPFIFRTVSLRSYADLGHWSRIKRLLERHGAHIWKLHLNGFDCGMDTTLMLKDILQYTPNLRMLLMCGQAAFPLAEEERRSLAESPFPDLPNLCNLHILSSKIALDAVLPSYSQNLLHLTLPAGFLEDYDSQTYGTFPSLKLLYVWVKSEEELRKLTLLESPLQNLTVHLEARIPLCVQMNVFRHFGKTLEYIKMEVDEAWAMDKWTTQWENLEMNSIVERWEFPHLTRICFTLLNNPRESLDWLTNIHPGPKYVEISVTDYYKGFLHRWNKYTRCFSWEEEEGLETGPPPFFATKMEGELVQMHGFLNKLDASAVWEMLPRLESVRVNTFLTNLMDYGSWSRFGVWRDFERPAKIDASSTTLS